MTPSSWLRGRFPFQLSYGRARRGWRGSGVGIGAGLLLLALQGCAAYEPALDPGPGSGVEVDASAGGDPGSVDYEAVFPADRVIRLDVRIEPRTGRR